MLEFKVWRDIGVVVFNDRRIDLLRRKNDDAWVVEPIIIQEKDEAISTKSIITYN